MIAKKNNFAAAVKLAGHKDPKTTQVIGDELDRMPVLGPKPVFLSRFWTFSGKFGNVIYRKIKMARADLIIRLVQAGLRNDKVTFRKVVESIIAEERDKQHRVMADNLEEQLNTVPSERSISSGTPMLDQCVGTLLHEILPQRKFADLILPDDVKHICDGIVQEHHRTDLL